MKYHNILTISIDIVCKIVEIYLQVKKGLGDYFKNKQQLTKQVEINVNGIHKANSLPRAFGGCNFTYIKLEFLHEDPRKLFELCLQNVPTEKDLSNIDLSKGYAYVRGLKYVGQLFNLGDTKHTRQFINENGLVDDWVKLSILEDKEEWKNADKNLKIMF